MTGTRKERRRREDEREILDAALRLFGSHGYQDTSMQRIAAAAEFSVGKIYTLFPSKDELLRSLHARSLRELDALIRDRDGVDEPPLDALTASLRTGFAFVSRHRDLIRAQEVDRPGRLPGAANSANGMFRDHTRTLLDRAVAHRDLKPIDTGLLATMIVGAGQALVDEAAADDGSDPCSRIADRVMDLMVRPHLMTTEAS